MISAAAMPTADGEGEVLFTGGEESFLLVVVEG